MYLAALHLPTELRQDEIAQQRMAQQVDFHRLKRVAGVEVVVLLRSEDERGDPPTSFVSSASLSMSAFIFSSASLRAATANAEAAS